MADDEIRIDDVKEWSIAELRGLADRIERGEFLLERCEISSPPRFTGADEHGFAIYVPGDKRSIFLEGVRLHG